MKRSTLVAGCMAVMSFVWVVHAHTDRTVPPTTHTRLGFNPEAVASPAGLPLAQSGGATQAGAVTAATAATFIKQRCLACHSEAARAAGMDSARRLTLDQLDPANVDSDRATWELVVRKLRAGMMPPAPMPRPAPAEFDAVISYFEHELDRTATPYMPAPGMHRLNRTEYANAVRDLLDLEIDPAQYLPSDDSTSGFDNIVAALGLSSTLVEAYVTAAQKISRLALGYSDQPTTVVHRTREDATQNYHIEGLPFGTRGGMLVRHVFPSDGEYILTVTPIFGDNMSPTGFGSVPCERLEILIDGQRLALMDWQGGRGGGGSNCDVARRGADPGGTITEDGPVASNVQVVTGDGGGRGGRGGGGMRVRFRTTAGPRMVGATFLATHYAPLQDLDRQFLRSTIQTGPTPGYTFFPHVGTIRIEGPYNVTPSTDSPSRKRIFVCTPARAADERTCAREIVTSLVTRAFRRPASAEDVDLLMRFYDEGQSEDSFEHGIELVLARILASPHFIYRMQTEPAAPRAVAARPLSNHELASRLSFFLWSTIPDEELLRVAGEGRLTDPAVLEAQARRMLQHPKSEALAVNFAGQWLNLRGLEASAPLPLVYPDFDDPLRFAMRREVELLFDAIVREDRPITELLTADYTFVNERLARHYGIPNIYGSQFRRIELGPEMANRHGLLGKGAFLVATSKPERTSPVTRGAWVMANLLGMRAPDPPPDVPPLPARADDPNAAEPTMRQKMLDHRVRPDCTTCHQLMDPIGFALEPFDGIGLLRSEDNDQPIDAAVAMFDSAKVDGPIALRQWLVNGYGDHFVTVATEKLLTYALGRGAEYRDMPLVRAIARNARANESRISEIILGIVRSEPFRMSVPPEQAEAPRAVAQAPVDSAHSSRLE